MIGDTTYLGYLALVRTDPAAGYTEADVDLARDIAGEVALALGAARSGERLRVSEERYRRIVDTTLEGVGQLDSHGVFTAANQPMATMLGLPIEELVGLTMHGFLDNQGQAELPRWLARRLTGQPGVYESRVVRTDGSARRVHVSVAPLPDDAGEDGDSLCMVTDITDQVQARGLKRQLDHLRRLDSLGQLIGGIAHDFNNLLTVVIGSAEVIASGAENGSTEHQLATDVVRAAARGRTLAHQLLAFGRGGGRPETVPIADLLDDVTQLLSRTLGEHIRLNITIGADVWPVRTERGPLEQALVNLAANARDAMPRGGVLTIHAINTVVAAGDIDDDTSLHGRFVRLTINDTGSGMDPETRQRAFEPFFTTKPTAAGLGLATAASIVRTGGGHLQLDSSPRIGTTVTLLLPAGDEAAAPAPAAPAHAVPGGHILVVEDQPELAQLIRHLLQPAGYTVTVVTDPQLAGTALPPGVHPDLLLTDVVMPGIAGPELAIALRASHPWPAGALYVGLRAGGPRPADRPRAGNLIQKPFDRDTLLAAVRQAWG